MLRRISIQNYRCFERFDLSLEPRHLIYGSNGAGKSTLFEVLHLLRDFSGRGDVSTDAFLGSSRTRWKDEKVQEFELHVDGEGGTFLYRLSIDARGRGERPRVRREAVEFKDSEAAYRPLFDFSEGELRLYNDDFENKVTLGGDWFRSALATVRIRPENRRLTWFKEWLDGVTCVQVNPGIMQQTAERGVREPAHDLADFASWYYHLALARVDVADSLKLELRDVMPGFQHLCFVPAGRDTHLLEAQFQPVSGKNNKVFHTTFVTYSFDELSDGQRALIALYALLFAYAKRPGLLCIDEPDNYVALREIQPWLFELIDAADESGAQILVASHHPELMNQMLPHCGLRFVRSETGAVSATPFTAPDDTTLTAAELVARGWDDPKAWTDA
ncbi:MAG: AAA family ATPase [Planctomycetes bacterium]|nr:AAA family ATPase [Planctomycetota bacterium]